MSRTFFIFVTGVCTLWLEVRTLCHMALNRFRLLTTWYLWWCSGCWLIWFKIEFSLFVNLISFNLLRGSFCCQNVGLIFVCCIWCKDPKPKTKERSFWLIFKLILTKVSIAPPCICTYILAGGPSGLLTSSFAPFGRSGRYVRLA